MENHRSLIAVFQMEDVGAEQSLLDQAVKRAQNRLYLALLGPTSTSPPTTHSLDLLARCFDSSARLKPILDVVPIFPFLGELPGRLTEGDVLLTSKTNQASAASLQSAINQERQRRQHEAEIRLCIDQESRVPLPDRELSHPSVLATAQSRVIGTHDGPLQFRQVAVGGTFDRLHAGHRLLLAATALVTTDRVFVGITGDKLLSNKRNRDLLEKYDVRAQNAIDYIRRVNPQVEVTAGPLLDPKVPPIAATEADFDAIVVSEETRCTIGSKIKFYRFACCGVSDRRRCMNCINNVEILSKKEGTTGDSFLCAIASGGVGILGAANIARKTCRALGKTDQLQVVAVGSRDISKAEALIAEWGLETVASAYGTYDEVLADERVMAVYVPLPTLLHMEWVRRAASKGKHILLEKPIAVSSADTQAILAACAGGGVQLLDGTMWMWHPRTKKMECLLSDGRLGDIKEVNAIFCFAAPAGFENNVRMKRDADPLGALGDLGWYCVRGILWALQYEPPLSVTAHQGAVFSGEGVPISIGATLLFSNGRRATFRCSFDQALTQRLEISGTQGTIAVDDFVIPREEKKADFFVTRDHGLGEYDTYDATARDVVTVYTHVPQEVLMWEGFAQGIRVVQAGGKPDTAWPRIAALTQEVLCSVLLSAKAGGMTIEFASRL